MDSNTTNRTTTYRRPASEEARQHANEYRKRYRQEHPDKAKKWRDDYIVRKAARLMAERAAASADDGDHEADGDSHV